MGTVYRPEDGHRRRRIEEALRDLNPSLREPVRTIIETYRGEDLEKKLAELVGYEKMRKIVDMK